MVIVRVVIPWSSLCDNYQLSCLYSQELAKELQRKEFLRLQKLKRERQLRRAQSTEMVPGEMQVHWHRQRDRDRNKATETEIAIDRHTETNRDTKTQTNTR